MKKACYYLVLASMWISCAKDRDAPAEKIVTMSEWTWVYSAGNGSESYTLGQGNKLASSIFFNSETTAAPVNYSYTRNASGQVVKQQQANGSIAYEYNADGRLAKSSSFNASGTLTGYYIHSYTAGGYERVSYSASGIVRSKMVFQYTADKKNIASRTIYNSQGVQTEQTSYTYLSTRSPEQVYPYAEVIFLQMGFANQYAVEAAATSGSLSGVPYSYTTRYTYMYDKAGYPVEQKETDGSGTPSSVTTYTYVEK